MNGFRILYHLGVNKKWYIKQHVKCFTILLLNVLASVSFPSFITKIVDQGLEKNSYTILVTQTALMAITGLVMVVTNYYRNQSYQKFSLNIILCAKSKLV